MANDDASCKRCRFWEFPLRFSVEHMGTCRRFPPTISVSTHASGRPGEAFWPETRDTDWCGEFSRSKINYDERTLTGKDR